MIIFKSVLSNGELVEEVGGAGRAGMRYEKAFKEALRLVGLNFRDNTGTGAVWDIHPLGVGWHVLIGDQDVNLKVSRTRWLFSDAAVYQRMREVFQNVKGGRLTSRVGERTLRNDVKEVLLSKGIADTVYMKPKSAEVEDAIIEAARNKDVMALKDLLVMKNFATKKLGKGFKVEVFIDWEAGDFEETGERETSWQKTAKILVSGGTGGKAFEFVGRVERVLKSPTLFFKDRSAKPSEPAHTAVKQQAFLEAYLWTELDLDVLLDGLK